MKIDQTKIKEILLQGSYIGVEDVKKAQSFVEKNKGDFLDYFINQGLLTADLIGQASAEYFKVAYLDLNTNIPEKDLVLKIPEEFARKFRVILFKETKTEVVVATDDPEANGLIEEIVKIFPDKKIAIGFSLSEDIDALLLFYKKTLDTRFGKIIADKKRVAPEIIDEIIADALGFKASDIHFDPLEKEIIIRFRIDGVLQEAGRIAKEYYETILNRVKVQAKLRIDEHFNPQDGAIRFQEKNKTNPIDMRVSIVPTLNGEKIAIRILSSYVKDLSLSDVGMSQDMQEQIIKSSKKSFGMILVIGPTGSGKTTTLYTLLKKINTPEINITTIEDPVEYKIDGINQIQANSQTNLTFARGLRSILRQDPNIILVGEIRDEETADIAVNATLTGHLLFSTFHANNVAGAIPRFLDIGIEPFLLSSTLELVIAQRLVRKICDSCRVSYIVAKGEISKIEPALSNFFTDKSYTLYKGKGCSSCANTGFKGRTGVFEFLTMTPEMQDLIVKRPSSKDIVELAKKQGFRTMLEDGVEKVKNGTTSLEELLRVVAP
jgi:type II secretory ATPase GspE/PulE/Tfp pilus assembly ATPase PilB-like protein